MDVTSAEQFRERLGYCISKVGSAYALAKRCGFGANTVRRYLENSEPTRPMLIAMARAAGVRLEWLATGEGPREVEPAADDTTPMVAKNRELSIADLVDVLKSRSAEVPTELSEEYAYADLPHLNARRIDVGLRIAASLGVGDFIVHEVESDTMEPTIGPGDLVVISREKSLTSSGVYLFEQNGTKFLARAYVDRSPARAGPDNPRYRPDGNFSFPARGYELVGRAVRYIKRKA